MTLIDPTGGVGYSFGQKLPSTHMTTIATQQPNAIDGVNGGTYAPAAPVILNGASALQLGGKLKYTSRSVTRLQPIIPQVIDLAYWNWRAAAPALYWRNLTAGTACQIELTKLAHNSTVNDLRVRFQGGGGHVGMPANKPSFRLYKVDVDNVYTALGAATPDPTTTVPNFEAIHSVSVDITGLSFVADLELYRYILFINAESGANNQPNAQVLGLSATMLVTEQPEV
jgi:hypothetical protein